MRRGEHAKSIDGLSAGDISLLVELLSLPGGDHFAPLELSPRRKKERTWAHQPRRDPCSRHPRQACRIWCR
jgi:hypothetical protein